MNVFELSAVTTPIAGAIAGAISAKASGATWTVLGICLGIVIGFALYFAAIGLATMLMRVPTHSNATEKLSLLQWLASMTAVLQFIPLPFVAFALSAFAVSRMLHLCGVVGP